MAETNDQHPRHADPKALEHDGTRRDGETGRAPLPPQRPMEDRRAAPLPPDHPPQSMADQNGKKPDDDKDGKEEKKKEPEDKRPIYKKPIFYIALVVLIVGGIIGFFYWLDARHYESTDDAFIEGHVVQISPQVAARVAAVHIDDNYHVKAGELLVELDPTDYQVIVDQMKAAEAGQLGRRDEAKANVTSSMAMRDEAKANVDAANVAYENEDANMKRYQALDDRARSKQQLDDAVTAQKNAAAQVAQAKAKEESAEAQITTSEAAVISAQGDYDRAVANRRQAEVNLSYCRIVAPVAGRITRKNIEPGMYAAVGTPFFAIVQDDVWVVANYKETQLTDMRVGQSVNISIDAYPDKKYTGKIESFQAGTGSRFSVLPAENATGNYVKVVQRVPVKIVFDDEQQIDDRNRPLAPGLSVEPDAKVR